MKKRESNIFKILLLILVFSVCFVVIQNTYSKYLTTQDSSAQSNISKWHILLNDQNISENTNFSEIVNLELDDKENINQNVIVPAATGKVHLTLESTGTELPFKYEIKTAEGIPTDSTYELELNSYWPNGSGGYTYEVVLDFVTYDYDGPINSWGPDPDNPGGNYIPVYGYPVLSFKVPDGFLLDSSNIWWAASIVQEGNTITLETYEWAWSYDYTTGANIFNQRLHLSYDHSMNIDTDKFMNGVSIDGKTMIESTLPDYRIYAYSINGGEKIELAKDEITITGTVEPPKDADGNFTGEEVINDFTLYVHWYDEDDNIYDNANDVMVSKLESPYATLNLDVKVMQIE